MTARRCRVRAHVVRGLSSASIALPPLPEVVEQFIQIKPQLLAEMRAGNLPCDLLVTPIPTPTFSLPHICDLFSHVGRLVLNEWDKLAYAYAECVISVSFTSLDATAVVEWGWSTVNYLKALNVPVQ